MHYSGHALRRFAAGAPPAGGSQRLDDDPVMQFARAALFGLSDTPRWLPCRYLYDARGSELFERISRTPEYYPTRTEASILTREVHTIRHITGPVTLIELGSGNSSKTDLLLEEYTRAFHQTRYVPVDVSAAALAQASRGIGRRHPLVRVSPIHGTYEEAFPLIERLSPAMVLFLGSTLGNFDQTQALAFWEAVSGAMSPGDFFLLGVDLVKDPAVLEPAYNDAEGITAEFTKNVFARMNRELGSEVDLDAIEHVAQYNEPWRRVEISARFLKTQRIHIEPLERTFTINAGEQIMIEISRKFVVDDLTEYLGGFQFDVTRTFTDPNRWFAVLLLRRMNNL